MWVYMRIAVEPSSLILITSSVYERSYIEGLEQMRFLEMASK